MHQASASRIVGALVARDLGCALRNPTVLICILVSLAACWFFGTVPAADMRGIDGMQEFLLAFIAVLPTLMAGGVVTLFAMSEEQAHGTYRVMARGGAPLGLVVAGKVTAGALLSAALTPLGFWLAGFAIGYLPVFAVAAVGSIASQMLFCAAALLSDDQMRTNFWAGPLVLIGMLPLAGTFDPALGFLGLLSPQGFLAGACAQLIQGTPAGLGMTVPGMVASGVLWLGLAAAALAASMRRWKRIHG